MKQHFLILFLIGFISICGLWAYPTLNASGEGLGIALAQTEPTEQGPERRIALVIGNSDYQSSPLTNPVNDAEDTALALTELGFTVDMHVNANRKVMRRAIRKFGEDLKKGGVGLFFYAGHGMQVEGINYLIPINSDIQHEDEIVDEAIDAGLVLRKMESAGNRLNMVFLDACRDNPFTRSFRSTAKGLAQMDAPAGSLIVYATAPGGTAADGMRRNGLFTENLLAHIKKDNVEIGQMLRDIRADVMEMSDGDQVPWDSSSMTGSFFFSQTKQVKATKATIPISRTAARFDAEDELWETIKASTNPQDLHDYLGLYPKGKFALTAKIKIRQLDEKLRKAQPKEKVTRPDLTYVEPEYEITHIRFFEGGKKAPPKKDRIYKQRFKKEKSRYIYTEVNVNNFLYKEKDQEHQLIWYYYNSDGTLRGKIKGAFKIKKEWTTSWIYRGWGWENYGNWPLGDYQVKLVFDGKTVSETSYTIY